MRLEERSVMLVMRVEERTFCFKAHVEPSSTLALVIGKGFLPKIKRLRTKPKFLTFKKL
jgi:hypothetical protein